MSTIQRLERIKRIPRHVLRMTKLPEPMIVPEVDYLMRIINSTPVLDHTLKFEKNDNRLQDKENRQEKIAANMKGMAQRIKTWRQEKRLLKLKNKDDLPF